MWSKNGWVGGYCVKKMVHFCVYCKKLERQKQDRLEKGDSVIFFPFYYDSSDKEKDAELATKPNTIEEFAERLSLLERLKL